MEKLIELNNKVEEILGLEVEYYSIDNYQLNGEWVTDIGRFHFDSFAKDFKSMIDDYINKDNLKEVVFMRNLASDLEGKLELMASFNPLEPRKFVKYHLNAPDSFPVYEPQSLDEFPLSEEGKEELIFEILLNFLGLSEDEFEEDEEKWKNLNALLESSDVCNQGLDEIYARAHLWLVLSYQRDLLEQVVTYFKNYLYTLSKMGIEVDNLGLKAPKSHPLYLNFSKEEVAIFFDFLFNSNYIYSPERGGKKKTPLKKFLSDGNIYYKDKQGDYQLVQDIAKEFSKVASPDGDNNIEEKERDLLYQFLTKVSQRLKQLGSE